VWKVLPLAGPVEDLPIAQVAAPAEGDGPGPDPAQREGDLAQALAGKGAGAAGGRRDGHGKNLRGSRALFRRVSLRVLRAFASSWLGRIHREEATALWLPASHPAHRRRRRVPLPPGDVEAVARRTAAFPTPGDGAPRPREDRGGDEAGEAVP